ncbi:MAG: hypothetical protein JJ939_11575 [Alphaproteobacteria bacterium]|nr:hypothetical protein [Alphaproteobacteria bacterium]MBO6629055.1 hypothetical protein [Alphaproteobacteria bacterium]
MNAHHSNRTQLTREGTRNMLNRKPYRTKAQREVARLTARKVDGRWVSSAPVSYHK